MKSLILKLFCLLSITLIVLIPACSPFKKIFKTKEYKDLKVRKELNSDLSYLKADKSVIAIKKIIDTTVVIPAKVVKQNTKANIDSLIKGIVAMQNDLVEVKFALDPETGVMETIAVLKPQNISVKINQTTTRQNDVVEQQDKKITEISSIRQTSGNTILKQEPTKVNTLVVLLIIFVFCVFFYFKIIKAH